MELSSFSENIVTVPYQRGGETVELSVNIDAMVPDYHTELERRLKPLTKRLQKVGEKYDALIAWVEKAREDAKSSEKQKLKTSRAKPPSDLPTMPALQKELDEINREMYAERLTCSVTLPDGSTTRLLKGWTVTENQVPIETSKEVLLKLPPRLVEDLWRTCLSATETVKKRVDEETEEISESTPNGSKVPLALAPTG